MGRIIQVNGSMDTLILEKNEIAAEGATAILSSLQSNSSLAKLHLSGNCNEALSVGAYFAARRHTCRHR